MNLSIVIPVFRNESTIARALTSIEHSVAGVDHPSTLNVVVVIDGIVDGSLDIVRSWQTSTKLSNHVIIQDNAGIAAARNVAWRNATTEWITFLDADDEMTTARLAFVQDRLRSGTVFIGQQDLVIAEGLRLPNSGSSSSNDSAKPTFHITSMLIERAVLDSLGGFDESLRLSDDWDLAIRLKEIGVPIEYVEEFFVRRHIHGQNASYDEATVSREYLRTIRDHIRRSRS